MRETDHLEGHSGDLGKVPLWSSKEGRRAKLQTKSIAILLLVPVLIVAGILSALIGNSSQANAASLSNTALKWSTQAAAGNGIWTSVAWSPELGKFVAVGRASIFPVATNKRMMTSTDGKNWILVNSSNIPSAAAAFTSVAWSPELDLFVAVACVRGSPSTCSNGATNLRAMTSPDGEVWTERVTADQTSTWQSIVWSSELDLFVAVADTGDNSIMTSPDGINWTARTAPEDNAWKFVTWSPEMGLFVAVATSGTNRVMTSPDGIAWTSRTASEANSWMSVTWSPELGKFVAISSDGTNRVMTSTNGINWTARAAPEANAWNSVVWSPGLQRFVAVASSGTNRIMTSADGETWTGQAASANNSWNAIVWSPELDRFVAVGSGGTFDTGSSTSPRAMTGSMVTAGTNDATNIAAESATLHGEYADDLPAPNLFFTGSNVFFRYRKAGSSDPFTATTPQAVTSAGAFSANITGLDPDNTAYEYKAVVQWANASGAETLEGGLQTFTTAYADDDNDSVPNVIEDAAPNSGDANNDGMPDSEQPFVAGLVNTVTNKYAALELGSTCQIDSVAVRPESGNAKTDSPYDYPAGLMSFTASCGPSGFTANVRQYYFGFTDADAVVRKYNPNTQAYFAIEGANKEYTTIGETALTKLTFQITDGGDLDMDAAANGTITDPAGLAVTVNSGLASTGSDRLTLALAALGLAAVPLLFVLVQTWHRKKAYVTLGMYFGAKKKR